MGLLTGATALFPRPIQMGEVRRFVFFLRNRPPCSINHAYSDKDKTQLSFKTRKWITSFKRQLRESPQISEIKQSFNKEIHFFTIAYFHFLPEKFLLTSSGRFAERSGDWSNWPKIADDAIFQLLGIDDAHVQRGWVEKLPCKGNKCHLKLIIEIHPLEKLLDRAQSIMPIPWETEAPSPTCSSNTPT